jgi:short-subunit dehydrogenase
MNFYANKTVWVIGGTSGIGLSIVQDLSTIKNCTVIVSGRSTGKVDDALCTHKVTLDVTDEANFSNAVDEVLHKHKRVDIILFCAGIYEPMNVDTFNCKSAKHTLDTNLGSMVYFIQNIPKFYGKCSTIGVISSVVGYFGMPNSLFYGASKAGLSYLTESLYIELKKHKIDVKLINPGFVKTPLTDKNSFKMPFIISPEKAAEIILKKLPKRKFEIAFPLIFVVILKIFRMLPIKLRSVMFN